MKALNGMGKDLIKANNLSAILSCIYKNEPISRRDIARMVGLTPPAVTLLVGEMLQCGLLQERGEVDDGPRAGRRMVELGFNPGFGYLLGISIEPAQLSFALTDLCGAGAGGGRVYGCEVIVNRFGQGELMDELLKLTDAFIARQTGLEGRFCAIGVSISGLVDPESGISVNSYGVLPPHTDVAGVFARHYGVPAFLDNNVRSLAQAEMALQAAADTVNGLFIKQDPGFGCTVLLGGEVFEGATNRSGEIGHAQVVDNGRLCSCGKTGCLSTVVGTNALLQSAFAAYSPSATPALWAESGGEKQRISVPMLVRSAAAGDAPVRLLLDEAARLMARVVETSLLLMDGDRVIAFGPLFEQDWFLDRLRELLDESFGKFREFHVTRSQLSEQDRWKGAVFSALRRYLRVVSGEISTGCLQTSEERKLCEEKTK